MQASRQVGYRGRLGSNIVVDVSRARVYLVHINIGSIRRSIAISVHVLLGFKLVAGLRLHFYSDKQHSRAGVLNSRVVAKLGRQFMVRFRALGAG